MKRWQNKINMSKRQKAVGQEEAGRKRQRGRGVDDAQAVRQPLMCREGERARANNG